MQECVIVGARRTPVGRLSGVLSSFTAPQLAAAVIDALIEDAGLPATGVDRVILGNVVSAGLGQNPGRQAVIAAGLSVSTDAFTVNKVCASGMEAVALGAQAIMLGEADCVIAGGMESMSNAPYMVDDMRRGKRYGDAVMKDAMIYDGLIDCYNNAQMGALCELTVKKYKITRAEQDAFALSSHRKAAAAEAKGVFEDEIVPLAALGAVISRDETIRRDTDMKRLGCLPAVFKKGGTITAGNSPGLNDGAAALLMMSSDRARRSGLKPMASIIAQATAHTDPKWYPIAPIASVKALLAKTGLRLDEFDLIEENEAFAAQTLAVVKGLSIDMDRLNVRGGAIALGHPLGASGARILVTLLHALRHKKKRFGLATMCFGGGGAMSMAVKRSS